MKISQAANYLGYSASALRKFEQTDKLQPTEIRGTYRYYSIEDLDKFKAEFIKQPKINKCTSNCKTNVFDIVQQQAVRIHELQMRIDKAIKVYRENKATIDSQRKEIQRLNDYIKRRGNEQLDFGLDDDFSV